MDIFLSPEVILFVIVIGTAIFSVIRGRMKSQLDRDIEQLKRMQKEVDRLRLELYD